MSTRLQEYVKYSVKELESYTREASSCVRKVNTDFHLALGPYCLADYKGALHSHIVRHKVGFYDRALDGIVLDVKNIKVKGPMGALRADDPKIHVDINADCYVFCPVAKAVLSGVVKYVGNHHVGVIIYRVFNANIRFEEKINEEEVSLEQEVQFRIKNFNLQNIFPYIEGELLGGQSGSAEGSKVLNKKIKFETEVNDSTVDSGIEEKDSHELDELITLIKKETDSDVETSITAKPTASSSSEKKKASKRKRKISNPEESAVETTPVKVKIEASPVKVKSEKTTPKKRKTKVTTSQELEDSI